MRGWERDEVDGISPKFKRPLSIALWWECCADEGWGVLFVKKEKKKRKSKQNKNISIVYKKKIKLLWVPESMSGTQSTCLPS